MTKTVVKTLTSGFCRDVDEIALFWGITQRRMVILYRISGQIIDPIFKGQEVREEP
jgi:hypothetical protein